MCPYVRDMAVVYKNNLVISTSFTLHSSITNVVPFSMADYRPDMEKRAEWPAPGRAAVSPFPGDIVPSRRVQVRSEQTRPLWVELPHQNAKLQKFY